MKRGSALARGLDLRSPSNAFAASALVVVSLYGTATALLREQWWPAVADGLQLGGAVFLAWAIARELDPDRPGVATAATVCALPLAAFGDPRLLGMLVALLALRVLAGTTGRSLSRVDVAVFALLAGAAALEPAAAPVAALVVAAMLELGRLHPPERPRRLRALALLVVVGVLAAPFVATLVLGRPYELGWDGAAPWQWVVVAAAVVAGAVAAVRTPSPQSRADHPRPGEKEPEPLRPNRIAAARRLAVVMGAASFAFAGAAALESLPALYATLLVLPLGILRRPRSGRSPQ